MSAYEILALVIGFIHVIVILLLDVIKNSKK